MNSCWQETLCAATLGIALLLVAIPEADAQSTRLTLDPPPGLTVGQYATFTGSLVDSSGNPISGAQIDIKDDDPGFDDYIATVYTDYNGRFAAQVLVKNWDQWSDTVEIYAVYEGGWLSKSRSVTWEVSVLPAQGSGGSYSGGYASSGPLQPQISLRTSSSSVYAGGTVTFSGSLTVGDRPLSGATIHIKEDDPAWRDETLATTTTDSQGQYSVTWRAKAGTLEQDFDVYAVFEETGNYLRAATPTYQLTVSKYSGSITLNPFQSSVRIGDPVTFSGHLDLRGEDTTNVIVYIMDEDPLNPDDLLATAYVNSDGSYAVTWIARAVDYDGEADIYAVFEGDSTHYRLTTCDPGPTRFFGGSCSDTVPLLILEPRPYVPPEPSGAEYMDLMHIIRFTDRPTVAIVPSREAYDTVRSYIAPSQEGLLRLSSELAARHGGDWDIRYEVIDPGKWRANARADVVLNIITGDQDNRCNSSWLGWAPAKPTELPIQISVCASSGSRPHSDASVMFTATHEFIHALGVGHTFNKKNDLMCSTENGKPTCPRSYTHEPRPSALNLEAIAAVYGRDGYIVPNNPNNFSIPGSFTLEDARAASTSLAPTVTTPSSTPGGAQKSAAIHETHTNDKIGISLEYPRSWDVVDHDEYTALLGPETDSSLPPYMSVYLVDYYNNIDEYVDDTAELYTLDNYQFIRKPLPIKIDGNRAFMSIYDMYVPDEYETTRFHEIIVGVGEKIYLISYLSDPSDYAAYRGQFYDVAKSIDFHDT